MDKNINGPKNVSAEDIWADQRCGGNAAYVRDSKEFESCLKDQKSASRTSADYIWAEQKCGGAAAYKADIEKFDVCVKQKMGSGGSNSLAPSGSR